MVSTYQKKEQHFMKEKKEIQDVQMHRAYQMRNRREQIFDKKQRMIMHREQELRKKQEKID